MSARQPIPVDESTFEPIPPNLASRLALKPAEAAAVLGISRRTFDDLVMPELRVVYVGSRRLIPVRELEKWVDASAIRAGAGK